MNPNFNNNNPQNMGPPQRPGGSQFNQNPNQQQPGQPMAPPRPAFNPNNPPMPPSGPNNNFNPNTNNNQPGQRPFGPPSGGPSNPNQNRQFPSQQPNFGNTNNNNAPGFRPQGPGVPPGPGPMNQGAGPNMGGPPNQFNHNPSPQQFNNPNNSGMGPNGAQGFNPMGGPGNATFGPMGQFGQGGPNNPQNPQFNGPNNQQSNQQSNQNQLNINNHQQPPQKTDFDKRLGQIQSIFPAEFRPNEVTAPHLFSQGQIAIALVCPTNLTYSFFAHQHLANHGYTAVTSYATHTPLEVVRNKKSRDGQEPPPRIYGCGQLRPLSEAQRGYIFATYRELLQECEKNQERNMGQGQVGQQQQSRGLYNILNYAIHPPVTAFPPLIRQRYNMTGSAPVRNHTLVKPAPTLFQTALNFSLEDHKRFANAFHPTEFTNPTSTSFTLTAQNHINWHQNIHRSPLTAAEHQNGNPLGPHLKAEVTGEEDIPPFDLILTYHPQVFTHVIDILQHYASTSRREVHIVNIPTKDEPTDVRLAGELTLELLNALHLSLDRSSMELPSQPMGRIDPATGKQQIFFKPLDLDGKLAKAAARAAAESQGDGDEGPDDTNPLDDFSSPTFQQHLGPFMQHTRGVALDGFGLDELGTTIPVPGATDTTDRLFGQATGTKPYSSFWNGSNIEAILTTVEAALGEKLLHCVVWL